MAANKGYFGVCPNCPADFKVAGNVTVAGGAGLATFAAAQNHALMGVGAEVVFNALTYYVASKVDQSNWYLVDANGVAAANAGPFAVTSITHPFASLSAAEAGYAALTGNADITAAGANQDLYFPCYCEQSSYTTDTSVRFDGPTCDATHEIFCYTPFNRAAECNFNHRVVNNGVWDNTRYRLFTNGTRIVELEDTAGNNLFVHFEGLQVRNQTSGTTTRYCFQVRPTAGSSIWIEKSILRLESGNGLRYGIVNSTTAGCIIIAKNNVIYLEATQASIGIGIGEFAGVTIIAIGNIIKNFQYSFWTTVGTIYGFNNCELNTSFARSVLTTSYFDYNLYREFNESEPHGTMTSQTDAELFSDTSGAIETWSWYPLATSDLIGSGIKLRDEDSADLDHGVNYRLLMETNPVAAHVDGDSFLPTDFLSPRGRWDIGPLAYYPQNFVAYGICPASPADFKVASQVALLDGILHCVNNQNHALMGIGARVDYDTTESCYVVGKLDQNEWLVVTASGAKPADTNNVTLDLITHPFASQSAFEAGIAGILGTSDLTTAEMNVHGVCYCEQAGFTVDNTAVTYDGTTCNATYQLYVYTIWDTVTQGNFQHRVTAGGVWDVQKYRLEVAAQILAVSNSVNQYINFSGIQFHMSSAAAAAITSIYVQATTSSLITIDSCVIRVADVNANWLRSALRVDAGPTVLSNCIVYLIGLNAVQVDFNGIIAAGADSTLTVAACTIYGWQAPITESTSAVVTAYNNAIIGNAVVCVSLTTQDYNVYDINEGETHGYLTAQADAALFSAVAGGRETWVWTPVAGSDLIFRARHFNNFTQDLDRQAGIRYQGIAPDAGAIELDQVVTPFGVCPNCPAAIETGTGTLTIVDGVGTFEIPQVNVLMGVGARITYGGATIAYVKEMINPFQFLLVTGAGAAAPNAADQAINAITHPFASQSAAEAGYAALTGNASLVAGDYQLWFPCYCEQAGATADGVGVVYDGPTCDFGHWITVFQSFSTVKESITQQRNANNGMYDVTKYRSQGAQNPVYDLEDTAGNSLSILFRGLQSRQLGAGGANTYVWRPRALNGSFFIIDSCICVMTYGAGARRPVFHQSGDYDILVFNTLFSFNALADNTAHEIISKGGKGTDYFINCLAYNYYRFGIENAGILTIRNTAILNTTTAAAGGPDQDYDLYRDADEGETNGIFTVQTDEELFATFNTLSPWLSTWTPEPGSNLINNGITPTTIAIDFAFMLQGDLDHPFETEWRPQDMTGFTRYDIGPLEKAYLGITPNWYQYW